MLKIRPFEPQDAEAVSDVIRTTMRLTNSKDYSSDVLEPLIQYFSPGKLIQLSEERRCLVAESNGRVVGTIALENFELCTFFVHPDFQGKGVGTELLKAIENAALSQGVDRIKIESSITGVGFYEKWGYRKTGTEKEAAAGRQIEMQKALS